MKKRVNVILILVSLIFLIHFISAAVPITVKTVKGHDVLLTIYEGESTQVYESKKFPMIETNSIEYSYTGIAKSLRIIVFVSVYGQRVKCLKTFQQMKK